MSNGYQAMNYCGKPTPPAIRSYSGECCVFREGHDGAHRTMRGVEWPEKTGSDDEEPGEE